MELQTSELTGSLKEEIDEGTTGILQIIYCIACCILHNLDGADFEDISTESRSTEEVIPSDMGPKMRVVIASSGCRLPTDAADVGFFTSVHLYQKVSFLLQLSSVRNYLQMVGQIVTP